MAFNRNVSFSNITADEAKAVSSDKMESPKGPVSWNPYKLPSGVDYHKWGEESEDLNILIAAHGTCPDSQKGDGNPDEYWWHKDIFIHEVPDVNNPNRAHRFPCLKMIGKSCPCCNKKAEMDNGDNYEEVKAMGLIAKARTLIFASKESDHKPFLIEGSTKQRGASAFVQRLYAQAVAMGRGAGPVKFWSPNNDGQIVNVTTNKSSFNGHTYYEPSAINFFPRKELVPDETYEALPDFNDVLNFASAEQMTAAMNGEEIAVTQKAASKPQHTEAQKQADFERACEESVQAPKITPKAPVSNGFTESDFDGDPYAKKPCSGSCGTCPNGFCFGKDCDMKRACTSCPDETYNACLAAKKNA